jgi:methyltransferase (TIGR00027 family)
MKANHSSITAENTAAVRAYESVRLSAERVCYDPFAKFFLSESLVREKKDPALLSELISTWDNGLPGVCNSVLARTRFIDNCLAEALEDGLEQLVILGAGYDTRAIRSDTIKHTIPVFELDHPATQKVKMQRLETNFGQLPAHVTFVPIRFESEQMTPKLIECGYDPLLKSFFIWEGVTYYIPASAVDHTLKVISGHSGPGSSVVFDYFPPSVVDGTCQAPEAAGLREGLKQFGEEIIFGIEPESITTFLNSKGFRMIKGLNSSDYHQVYFTGQNRNRTVSEIFHFVWAEVKYFENNLTTR